MSSDQAEAPEAGPLDHRFLFVVLVFGVFGIGAGSYWLSNGSIVIRERGARVGVGGARPRPVPQGRARAAGIIENNSLLYYPLCITWVALGVSMIAVAGLAFFSNKLLYLKLSAFSLVAILVLAASTVFAALRSGP